MNKVKYYYDTKTLAYKKIELSKAQIIKRIAFFSASSLTIAIGLVFLFFSVFDSPKEKELKREIENLQIQYQLLDEKIASSTLILDELQERDDNIYRVIFEGEPIDASIRKAGYGGVNRYNKYEGFKYSELITELHKKIDQISKAIYVQSKSYDTVIKLAQNKQ